jgi:hypothetical protein
MDVTYEDEDKEVMLLCSLPESWDHLVTTMWFITTDAIDYDTLVGYLLSEEIRKRSSKERGKNQRGTSRSKSKGKKSKHKCWFCGKSEGYIKV